ncbi:MAG TPA: helix-turn-helix domain-containing protein [Blastocatellia bacterium]
MSVYDSKDLMSFNAASREFDVPATTLELAAARGALRIIHLDNGRLDNGPDNGQGGAGQQGWLLRPDVEQFVKRTIKRGYGNKVVTRIR